MTTTVGIVGGSISGNKGAEAMVSAVMGSLRARLGDVRFVLWSPYYNADKDLGGRYENTAVADGSPAALVLKAFPQAAAVWLLRHAGIDAARRLGQTRLLAQCDVLVDVAGISFSDGREIFLPFNVLTIWPAMMMGVRVAKMSQACGPFKGRINRFLAKRFLPRCRYLAARGAETARNLQKIGITNAPVCPDVAFLLNDFLGERTLAEDGYFAFGDRTRRVVGISPSSVVYKGATAAKIDYVGIHAEFVRGLVTRGYRVILVPHSMRPGTDETRNNDLPIARAIMGRLGKTPEAALVEDELDSIALRRVIGRCDFFLASRFHGMISALAMSVPVMVCGWGHKYLEILDMFGQSGYAFDYRGMSAVKMAETFDRLARDEKAVREAISAALPGVLAKARTQIDAVAALVQSGRQV